MISKSTSRRLTKMLLATVILLAAYVFFDYVGGLIVLKQASSVKSLSNQPRVHKRTPVRAADLDQIAQFQLTAQKIGVSVAVVPNVDAANSTVYNQALSNGVAHYKGTAMPASGSNVVIFGHSSSNTPGPYAKVFARLNELQNGDEVSVLFNHKQYRYAVSSKKIVEANDFSVVEPTDRERLTLLTCWPIGTDKSRLAVVADPIH